MRKRKCLVYIQAAALSLATMMSGAANADIISTQRLMTSDDYGIAVHSGSPEALQKSLQTAMNNREVVDKLVAMGVDPDAARARIANMTDAEAKILAAKADSMPAGGDVVLLLVIIILVLLLR